jgi:D-3-phosphoglycerate dehydrogenase / 2-oxoglutarate reductase
VTLAPKVVVAGAGFPTLDAEQRVLSEIGAEVVDARRLGDAETLGLCRPADAIMTDYFRVDADVIRQLERCRVICQYGVGLDQLDVDAATIAGILVTHTPEYCVDELADHTLALLLAVARKIVHFDREVRAGTWDYNLTPPMHRLRGRTLGLVGFGRVGRAVAERARPLGLRVLASDPYVTDADIESAGAESAGLERLLKEADIISLHAPLTDQTRGLIGAAELATLKAGAILINTARGGLVDEASMLTALEEGRLAGAGLDVLAREPPDPDDPLLACENVVLTPHAGFLSEESLIAVQTQAAEEVRLALEGRIPRHAVNAAAVGR